MKNIYNISQGQLIGIWVFGLLSVFTYFIGVAESEAGFFTGAFVLMFFLVFYTIGWKNNKK